MKILDFLDVAFTTARRSWRPSPAAVGTEAALSSLGPPRPPPSLSLKECLHVGPPTSRESSVQPGFLSITTKGHSRTCNSSVNTKPRVYFMEIQSRLRFLKSFSVMGAWFAYKPTSVWAISALGNFQNRFPISMGLCGLHRLAHSSANKQMYWSSGSCVPGTGVLGLMKHALYELLTSWWKLYESNLNINIHGRLLVYLFIYQHKTCGINENIVSAVTHRETNSLRQGAVLKHFITGPINTSSGRLISSDGSWANLQIFEIRPSFRWQRPELG